MRKLASVLLLAMCVVYNAEAQTKNGSVSGIITTSEGRPAADVTVQVQNSSKGAVSEADGTYEIKKLAAGNYVLQISLIGYSPVERSISVRAGETQTANFNLQLTASELQEVVIRSGTGLATARKPSPSLRLQTSIAELPQNIQVVSREAINEQQVFDLSEGLTRNVSGATYSVDESWGNYSNIAMRGSLITPLRNGMNVKMPWGPLIEDVSMVDRIEFVKGPAGFLFANAEPTGLYNIVTKKPSGVTRGEAAFSIGSFDTYRSTLDLDGRLSDDGKLLYRFNLMGQLKNSHRQYEFNNRYSIVPVITYKFDDHTSLTAEYTYQNMKMAMLGSSYLFSLKMGDLPRSSSMLEANLPPSKMREHNLYLTLNHQLANAWHLTSQVAYLNYLQEGASIWPSYPEGLADNGNLVRSIANWDAASEARMGQMFVNGQFNTGALSHRVLGGVDLAYKNYYADFYQFANITGYDAMGNSIAFNIYNPVHGPVPPASLPKFDRSLPLRSRAFGTLGESSNSIYLQDEISILRNRVRLTAAGRYTKLKQHSFGTYSNDKEFTPRAGISVSLDKTTALYGLYDKAFTAQQGMDSANKPFVPLTGSNVEAGIKRNWAGGTWVSTLSVYRITRNDVISFVPGPQYIPVQTGQTRTSGAELDVKGEVGKWFSALFNYAYSKSEITRDEDPSKIGGPVEGPQFAKHVSNAWLSYRFSLAAQPGFGASLGYQFQGGRPYELPDYWKLDAALHWSDEKFRISLNANNLLNKYLYNGAPYEYNNNFASTEYYFIAEPGINFRLSVGYRW